MAVKEDSPFNIVILRGYETTYTISEGNARNEDQQFVTNRDSLCNENNLTNGFISDVGDSLALMSVLQARNGARVIFSGSLDLFSDEFLRQSPSNLQMVQNLGEWFLNRRGRVRVKDLRDKKLQGESQEIYTIRDSLV
jgi:hypothetical protein